MSAHKFIPQRGTECCDICGELLSSHPNPEASPDQAAPIPETPAPMMNARAAAEEIEAVFREWHIELRLTSGAVSRTPKIAAIIAKHFATPAQPAPAEGSREALLTAEELREILRAECARMGSIAAFARHHGGVHPQQLEACLRGEFAPQPKVRHILGYEAVTLYRRKA